MWITLHNDKFRAFLEFIITPSLLVSIVKLSTTANATVPGSTCRSYQSSWSGSKQNTVTTCCLPICCRRSSLVSDLATPWKPLPCGCFLASLRQLTLVMLQHWSSWTCRLNLTLSTMLYYVASAGVLWTRWPCIICMHWQSQNVRRGMFRSLVSSDVTNM